MGDLLTKHILVSVSVVLLSTLVGVIAWTVTLGYSIAGDAQSKVITYYSEAGLSMMINAHNIDSVDSANLYRMLEVNRNLITDYSIKRLDNSTIKEFSDLLDNPTSRYKVVIRGDSAVGFEITATEIKVEVDVD